MARDLIPPPSPAGRPRRRTGTPRTLVELPPEPPPRRRRRRRSSRSRPPADRSSATASGSCSARSPACRRWPRSCWRSCSSPTAAAAATDDGPAPELVDVAAAGHESLAGRRGGDRRRTSAPSTSTRTASSCVEVTAAAARRSTWRCGRRPARSRDRRRHASSTSSTGWAPNGSIKGGEPSERGCRSCTARRWSSRSTRSATCRTSRGVDGAAPAAAAGRRARQRDARPPQAGRRRPEAAASRATPSRGEAAHRAIFYRPGDLKPQLQIPLGDDAPGRRRRRGHDQRAPRRRPIDTLTLSNLFTVECRTAAPARILVLDRLDALTFGLCARLRAPARDPQHARVRVLDVRARTGR